MTAKVLSLVTAAIVLVPIAGASAATSVTAPKKVTVTMTDAKIHLSLISAPIGSVTFTVTNTGKLSHNFTINSKKTATIAPKKKAVLTVKFTAAKSYTYKSTLPVGKTKGLTGIFKVTKPAVVSTPIGNVTTGKSLFASNGCGGCHTLKSSGATGTVGPNLDNEQPSYTLVIERVTSGKRVMPSYSGSLSKAQIQDLAAYVSTATK